jgi:catechol 2,3-dioxygenase-like lactoylglutathione lyase family enzyme
MRFHHTGILTSDLNKSLKTYTEIYGFSKEHGPVFDQIQECDLCTLVNSSGYRIELIEPKENSPVFRLFSKRGPGPVHHCFVSDQFDNDCEKLRSSNFVPIGKKTPANLFRMKRVMFFLSPDEEIVEVLEN